MGSEEHEGHVFVKVSETKKEMIKKDTNELECIIFPKYEDIALDLENQLANLDGGYIWETYNRNYQTGKGMEKTDRHRYQQNENRNRRYKIETEVSPIIEYSSKIRDFSKLPPKIQVSLPTFIPKPIDHEKLYNLFGQITQLSTATEENILLLNQPNTSVRKLLDEPELVVTIQTEDNVIRSVTCLNNREIWTSGETRDIKCFSIAGSLLQTIETKSGKWPSDIAVDRNGDLLYSDRTTKTVNKVKNGQMEELITLQGWTPDNLSVTSIGDLLVTMYSDGYTQSKLVRYSGSTEKQTIQFDHEGKPLYSRNNNSKYITENRNHDICVADMNAGAVVVANQDGEFRWRYTGYHSVTKSKPLKPHGITSDSQSRILTADGNNRCIHILDQDGQFLRYIDNCDLKKAFGLCVDGDNNLFVCEYHHGIVKKIKY
ncbi:uncharacterized protein LOC128160821 [Crassostrea angulata]|uniref:uncharacterized protein LOC128160821 n=1 Tax=Magallana angulata TaxID=2784310 RepID=UPI0022B0C70B|nr:uncharacterized protein LOC128160821 [Crassostrea angulata]